MKRYIVRATVAWLALVLLVGGCAPAGTIEQQHSQPAASSGAAVPPSSPVFNGFSLFTAPTASTPQAITPKQDTYAQRAGTPLPTPELLQPAVDPALPSFIPRLPATTTVTLSARCSATLAYLAKDWVAAFQSYYPGISIELPHPYIGTTGTRELTGGQADFVLLAREPRPTDLTEFHTVYGYDMLTVPICGGSWRHAGFTDTMVFVVHKDNPLEKMTFQQIDALYSKTRNRGARAVEKWGDLGLRDPWANLSITKYGVGEWHSSEEFLRSQVLSTADRQGQWRDDILLVDDPALVAGNVAQDPHAIGYTCLSAVDADVKILSIARGAEEGYYPPTYEYVASAEYPLSRQLYLCANKRPDDALNEVLAEFLRFLMSRQAAQVVVGNGVYLPFTAVQAGEVRSLFQMPHDVIQVVIDGITNALSTPPLEWDGLVWVPLEVTVNALGGAVDYDEEQGCYLVTKGENQTRIWPGSALAYRNGEELLLEVPARIITGNTLFVPLSCISAITGFTTRYDEPAYSIYFTAAA